MGVGLLQDPTERKINEMAKKKPRPKEFYEEDDDDFVIVDPETNKVVDPTKSQIEILNDQLAKKTAPPE